MKKTIQQKLNIKYPILQAPMAGGITTPEFIAQVSNFGILGAIPSGYMPLKQVWGFIESVKALTSKAFSINLFVDYNCYSQEPLAKPKEILKIEAELGISKKSKFTIPSPPTMSDLIELIIEQNVPVVSTAFGLLKEAEIAALKKAGVLIMTTVNSVEEAAIAFETQDSDVLIYQNSNAGGHQGGFKYDVYSTEVEFTSFMQNYSDKYLVMTGGIVTRDDVKCTLKKGFDGVQIGTGFLTTHESTATKEYKKAIIAETRHDATMFTISITGKKARGLKNTLALLDIKNNLGFPHMHYASMPLRKYAKDIGNTEFQSLWAGSGINKIDQIKSLNEYMNAIIK